MPFTQWEKDSNICLRKFHNFSKTYYNFTTVHYGNINFVVVSLLNLKLTLTPSSELRPTHFDSPLVYIWSCSC